MGYSSSLVDNLASDLMASKLSINSLRRELSLVRRQLDEKDVQYDLAEKRIDLAIERHGLLIAENKRLRAIVPAIVGLDEDAMEHHTAPIDPSLLGKL
jgi:hypothetical protein